MNELKQAKEACESALKHVRYDEGVVIGSYIGMLEKQNEEMLEQLRMFDMQKRKWSIAVGFER